MLRMMWGDWVLLQIPVEDKAAAGRGGTIVQRLAVSRYHPLMLAGTATGTVLLYDLRSPRTAAATLKPHTSPMVGALALLVMPPCHPAWLPCMLW